LIFLTSKKQTIMKTIILYNQLKKHFLLFFVALLCSETLQAQTTPEVLWAKQFGGAKGESVMGIDVDESGNIYIAGIFGLETSIGDITLTTPHGTDSFVAKTDSSGNVLWVKQFGGELSNVVKTITTDDLGYIYTSGHFSGITTFDSLTLDAGSYPDIFVVKQDASGNVLWVTQFGGTNLLGVESIGVDSMGNVYTLGYFYDNITIGNNTLTSYEPGKRSPFIAKQDASGNVLWAKKIDHTDFISVKKIAIDTSDDLYIAGVFWGTVDFDGTTLISSDDGEDFFLVKLNSSGQTK